MTRLSIALLVLLATVVFGQADSDELEGSGEEPEELARVRRQLYGTLLAENAARQAQLRAQTATNLALAEANAARLRAQSRANLAVAEVDASRLRAQALERGALVRQQTALNLAENRALIAGEQARLNAALLG